jgi:hypothetical protein
MGFLIEPVYIVKKKEVETLIKAKQDLHSSEEEETVYTYREYRLLGS